MQSTVLIGVASYSNWLFCDLPLDNKLGSQVCKGKHQRTGNNIGIIVINTCFPLITSLYGLKFRCDFITRKQLILFIPLFWNKKIFVELLTKKNIIINYKLTNPNPKG